MRCGLERMWLRELPLLPAVVVVPAAAAAADGASVAEDLLRIGVESGEGPLE